MRTNVDFLVLERNEIRACLSLSDQIFIFLKQVLENNARENQTASFRFRCLVLYWLSIRVNDVKFQKKKRRAFATQKVRYLNTEWRNRRKVHFKYVC